MKQARLVKKHSVASIRFMEILIDESMAVFLRHGETRADAEKMSRSFALEVSRKIEGDGVYLSKNSINQAHSKYESIREDWRSGKTINQLSEDYNLSDRRIYTILFELKDGDNVQSANTTAQTMAVTATRRLMSIGLAQEDARNAARGLLAVISAKIGGQTIHIPKVRNIQRIIRDIKIFRLYKSGKSIGFLSKHFNLSEKDINDVINWYPATKINKTTISGLTLLKRQVLDVAESFKGMSSDVHNLLCTAAEKVAQARELAESGDCGNELQKEVTNINL